MWGTNAHVWVAPVHDARTLPSLKNRIGSALGGAGDAIAKEGREVGGVAFVPPYWKPPSETERDKH